MKALDTARDAIAAELVRAQAKFDPFNSAHEGYAVILEEAEELGDELADLMRILDYLWTTVRHNDLDRARTLAEQIASHAERATTEAIQVGAMARRFLADLPAQEEAAPARAALPAAMRTPRAAPAGAGAASTTAHPPRPR